MTRDLYDDSIMAYKTGTQQTVSLALDAIRLAIHKEKKDHCGVVSPQLSGVPVYRTSIL